MSCRFEEGTLWEMEIVFWLLYQPRQCNETYVGYTLHGQESKFYVVQDLHKMFYSSFATQG